MQENDNLLNIASEFCEDGKYMEAIRCYDKILCVEPDNLGAIIDKGVTLQNLGYHQDAIQMYDKALILKPDNLDALINKGSALHTLKNN